jgi:hypothetical protein
MDHGGEGRPSAGWLPAEDGRWHPRKAGQGDGDLVAILVLPGLDEQAAGQVARLILGAGDPVPGMLREQTVSIRPPAADQRARQDRKGAGQ